MLSERKILIDADAPDEQINRNAVAILSYLRANQSGLAVDEIIEALTHLGDAPSILYDDNGHFTIGGDGIQNLPTIEDGWATKRTTFEGTWSVEPGGWKCTIREALGAYLSNLISISTEYALPGEV